MSSNICQDQTSFNNAIGTALDSYAEDRKVPTSSMYLYLVLVLIFFLWAIVLAFRLKRGNERTLHLFLAMIASPVYVISYYLNCLS